MYTQKDHLLKNYIQYCCGGEIMTENEEVIAYNEKYEILHLIAQGSFGKVYKAVHKETQKIYAIKVSSIKHIIIFINYFSRKKA